MSKNKNVRFFALPRPFTGCEHRMKTLPHVNITSIEHHNEKSNEPFVQTHDDVKKDNVNEFLAENLNRKCVYTYEDRYGFSRILNFDSLVFDSHFESGNLHSAFRVLSTNSPSNFKPQVYDLYLHTDLNTIGHTQWFYFSVSNIKKGQEVTFVIRNFQKAESLFNDGMRPLIYSCKSKRGWERCGTNISYFGSSSFESLKQDSQSGINEQKRKNVSSDTYILCFSHAFEYDRDVCYFSHCHPFTYTDLQLYIRKTLKDPRKSLYVRKSLLCKSAAGNNCDLLTITSPTKSIDDLNSRMTIFLTARVHPGESNASWIMQGMIDLLLSEEVEAEMLRESYIFKVIPMLNPDGVVNGNYRTALSGNENCFLNK